ncbi:MAG: molybdenum cofactor guanylyltransferase [Desulfovibrionales bacterium]
MKERGVIGAVLAGGKSRRLGRDKASVIFEGTDLLKRTVTLLQPVCDQTWVVGRDPARHEVNTKWLLDDIADQGPMGGIVTVLRRVKAPCLVLTCDLPLLNNEVIARLLRGWGRRREDTLMTTFLHPETGYIEPLVAVYEPEALPLLELALERGIRKLSMALPERVRHHIPCPEGMARVFFNINYPADLLLLQELEAMRRSMKGPETEGLRPC